MDDEPRKKREESRSSNHVADDELSTPPLAPGRPDEARLPARRDAKRAQHGGPYRDARDVLLAKRRRVLASLAQAERAAEQAASLRDELAYVESSLRTSAASMLERDRAPTPCRARWEDLVGDAVVRHCGRCGKDVYDLASMTTSEAEALLARDGESPCVRLRRRRDGRVVTSDCPPPSWSGARAAGAASAVAVALTAGALSVLEVPASSGQIADPEIHKEHPEEVAEYVPVLGQVEAWNHRPGFAVSPETLATEWPGTTRMLPHQAVDGSLGVKVYGVRRDSALAAMGLQNGDLVLGIGATRIKTPADLIDAIGRLRENVAFVFAIERRGVRAEHVVLLARE